jgi:hypothetical protein
MRKLWLRGFRLSISIAYTPFLFLVPVVQFLVLLLVFPGQA